MLSHLKLPKVTIAVIRNEPFLNKNLVKEDLLNARNATEIAKTTPPLATTDVAPTIAPIPPKTPAAKSIVEESGSPASPKRIPGKIVSMDEEVCYIVVH